MKKVLAVCVAFASVLVFAQEGMPDPTPPKEVGKLSFLLGKWSGNLTDNMTGKPMKMKSTVVSRMTLGGRFLHSEHTMMAKGAPPMFGLLMMTYDADKKAFVGNWFDSMAAGNMEMTGNFMGNTLRLVSKPTPMPGSPEPVVMRTTWTKKSASVVDFALEMQAGDKWAPIIFGTMKKVGK